MSDNQDTNRSVAVRAEVRVNAYRVIEDAIERGIAWGWQHAHKHVDNPDEHAIKEAILGDIMNELCEVVDFGD